MAHALSVQAQSQKLLLAAAILCESEWISGETLRSARDAEYPAGPDRGMIKKPRVSSKGLLHGQYIPMQSWMMPTKQYYVPIRRSRDQGSGLNPSHSFIGGRSADRKSRRPLLPLTGLATLSFLLATNIPYSAFTSSRPHRPRRASADARNSRIFARPASAGFALPFLSRRLPCRGLHMSVSGNVGGDLLADYNLLDVKYEWNQSTMENYGTKKPVDFVGPFADIRRTRDYSFHCHYPDFRQRTQDDIVQFFLGKHSAPMEAPKIVFSAGGMGVGKSAIIQQLVDKGVFSLPEVVHIDMDRIRAELPEWERLNELDHLCLQDNGWLRVSAGDHTQREAGLIQEILLHASLASRRHIFVDGTMHNATFWEEELRWIKKEFPDRHISILEVYAGLEETLKNVKERSSKTGRMVPENEVIESHTKVPESVAALCASGYVDACYRLENVRGASMPGLFHGNGTRIAKVNASASGPQWDLFARQWTGGNASERH